MDDGSGQHYMEEVVAERDALRARVEALEASLKELLEIAEADYEFRGVDTSFIDRARALERELETMLLSQLEETAEPPDKDPRDG